MTWSLSAAGHTPADGRPGDTWAPVEQALFDELQAVLSKPEYGCASSNFHGNYVDGNPHAAPEDSTHTHEHTQAEADADGAELPGDTA